MPKAQPRAQLDFMDFMDFMACTAIYCMNSKKLYNNFEL